MFVVVMNCFEEYDVEFSFLQSVKDSDGTWSTVITPSFGKARRYDEMWQAEKAKNSFPQDVEGISFTILSVDEAEDLFVD